MVLWSTIICLREYLSTLYVNFINDRNQLLSEIVCAQLSMMKLF